MERNPDGSITKRKIVKEGRKIWVWDVRKQYLGANKKGQPVYKSINKRCYTFAEAKIALQNMPGIIEEKLNQKKNINHNFLELCAYFREKEIKPPVYIGKRKIAGYKKDLKTLGRYMTEFEEFFGEKLLQDFCYEDIRQFAEKLATTVTKKDSFPAAATIHQKLGFLRRVFKIGLQLGWIKVSPFNMGDSLIRKSAENKRNRMLTFDEEVRLLEQCTGNKRYLQSFILLSLDTAMRRGEIYNLLWKQVDFDKRVIYLTEEAAEVTKTGVEGILPITQRLYDELQLLKKSAKSEKVVGKIDFKKSFAAACSDAGITNLQFRDLRATGATRMMLAGNAGDLVRKITRHTEAQTFYDHYTGVDVSNAQLIGEKLQDFIEIQQSKAKAKAKAENVPKLKAA